MTMRRGEGGMDRRGNSKNIPGGNTEEPSTLEPGPEISSREEYWVMESKEGWDGGKEGKEVVSEVVVRN
jgi:hypothetical protein